jgi:N-acetylneuraminate synthase
MVGRTRELECSLGAGVKKVEDNEKETVVLQRRSIRLKADLQEGARLTRDSLLVLRPCPDDALPPNELNNVVGRQLKKKMKKGDCLRWRDIK